jgi:hypothetical protein
MANDDQRRQRILDSLLSSPPDEVLAMLQNDLRFFLESIEAGLFTLSEKPLPEDHDAIIERMKQNTKSLRNFVDLILDYLKRRREMNESGDEKSL